MMRIYLAGPMRNYPRNNFPAFDAAAAKLRADGHEVFNPAEHDRKTYGDGSGKLFELWQDRPRPEQDQLANVG